MRWYNKILAGIVGLSIVLMFLPLRPFIKWEGLMDEIRKKAEEE